MEELGALFLRVLTLSAGCSAVLAPLLLLIPRIQQRVAARSLYVLFLLLALRLVLPVEIRLPAPAVTVPTPDYTFSVPAAPAPAETTLQPLPELPAVQAPAQVERAREVPVTAVLGAIWVLGAVSCALWAVGSYLLARRKLWRGSVPATAAESDALASVRDGVGVRRPVALRRSGAAVSPLALGLFRPVIVLPERFRGGEELELALRHELTHIRRWDVAYKLALSLACWVNWFNPLVWLMNRAAGRNLELCCDDEATRGLSDGERRRYGEMLLDAAAARPILFSTCFAGGKKQMKERLQNLFTKKRNSAALVCLVLVAALLAGGLVSCEGGTGTTGGEGSDPALLEFPGTHWNDTPEAVLEALKITSEQITSDEADNEMGVRVIRAENISCFGGTAGITLVFMQEESSPMGLYQVGLRFSDDTDMDAVKAELTRLYGESSQEKPKDYSIHENRVGTDYEIATNFAQNDGDRTYSLMTVSGPGQEPFTYRTEPNEHTLYWSGRGKSLLPEEFDESKCAAIFAQRSTDPASAEAVSQWLEVQPLVRLSWTDAYVLEDYSLKTNKLVVFDAGIYLQLLQTCTESAAGGDAAQTDAGGRELSAATPENEVRRELLKDYFYANFQEDTASVVLADLTGDELEEMLVLTMHTTSDTDANLRQPVSGEEFAYGELNIYGVKDGAAFQYNSIGGVSNSHAGWGYEYLVPRSDGNGFALLDFRPYIAQGSASYTYGVFVLEETDDEWLALDGGEAYFSLDPVESLDLDVGDDATPEEAQALLDRAQAYRDSGVPLLCFYSDGAKDEFSYLNAAPADAFTGKLNTLSALRGGVATNGYSAQFPLPPAGPATPEEALDRLEASVEAYPDGWVFRIPNYDGEWNVHIAGRMRMDSASHPADTPEPYMSVHYLEDEEWIPGRRYSLEPGEGADFSELTLDATVTAPDGTQAERTIDLVEPREDGDSGLPDGGE